MRLMGRALDAASVDTRVYPMHRERLNAPRREPARVRRGAGPIQIRSRRSPNLSHRSTSPPANATLTIAASKASSPEPPLEPRSLRRGIRGRMEVLWSLQDRVVYS